jgi:threonine synthase
MFVTHLECLRCSDNFPMDAKAYLCSACGASEPDPGILDVQYDYDAIRKSLPLPDHEGVFRYLPLLPLNHVADLLPAGATPLVPAPRIAERIGAAAVYIKDETRNPTRCLKDRATAVGMSMALELGASDVYCASAGNAAISLAAFAANAGLRCHAFVPSYASEVRLDWLKRFGADVRVSTGDYDQAFAEAERAGSENGWYSRNCAFNPFLVEGKKTCALEIAEQIEADVVVAPVGDGCTLGAIGKGFREAREVGMIERLPKLIGVQASGIAPMAARFRGDAFVEGETQASSIAVRRPRNALRLLREIKESGGAIVAVSDDAIANAQRILAEEAGVVAEFTSASTLAAAMSNQCTDFMKGAVVVFVVTGGRVD